MAAYTYGNVPKLCQSAFIEMLEELFDGRTYSSPEGKKALNFYAQDLPIPEDNDEDADTDTAPEPYIIVALDSGVIEDDHSPQKIDMVLTICTYDDGTDRSGWSDVLNIKEDIVQRLCAKPYFGGIFTVLKPIAWAMQADDTAPQYYGAVTFTATAPAMTQDTELEELV